MDKETKRICLQDRDDDKITEYLEKGYDVIYPVFDDDRYSSAYVILVNSLNDKLEIAKQELDKYKNIVDEIEECLTPDYEEYKKLIDKRDYLTDINDNYWLGVAETSEWILDKLKELRGFENE